MKKIFLLVSYSLFFIAAFAQNATIPVGENLVIDGIPPLSSSLVNEVKNYNESRSAAFVSWHPVKKEMMITTRFANSAQLHYVKFPGGDRKQITFFEEPISSANFEPKSGKYFLFLKDTDGNEFRQIYRFDLQTKKSVLLTDGKKSQNGNILWNKKGNRIAFTTTQRNGKDRDFCIMDPLNPRNENRIIENSGGGWSIIDWNNSDNQLLIGEYASITESKLYLLDLKTGSKTKILPLNDASATYNGIGFSKDNKGFYLITNLNNEFNRLAYYNLSTQKLKYITSAIPWDVENVDISKDGKSVAFVTNENGLSKLYILNTTTQLYKPVSAIPVGVLDNILWSPDSKSIGFTLGRYNSSADVYEYNTITKTITRWTESELGGIDASALQEPKLITWKSFDNLAISGYLYKAAPSFTGKRPVIINIHGGPESQSRPGFLGRSNYYLNELGVSIIYPNVRGSEGYGKTFLELDNGRLRENSVKDIGALIDWISLQPDLDKDRILVTGGSYGGYMSLAVSYLMSDKIRCAIDIVGISNFNTFLKNTESYRRDLRRAEYGNEQDSAMAAFFEEISPLNHTDKIKKPLFIIQGANDPRVPYTEATQMKDKIKLQGGTVWFLMANDEGHGFRKKKNADFQFYATIEFIKKYLID